MINTPIDATEDDIAWIKSTHKKRQELIFNTKAKVIYTDTKWSDDDRLKVVDNPKLEICKLMRKGYVFDDCFMPDVFTGGKGLVVGRNTVIGREGFGFAKDGDKWIRMPHQGKVIIGDNVEIGSNCTIDRGCLDNTVIGNGVKIDNLCHIAHSCKIGDNTIITAGVIFSGSVTVGKNVWIAPNSTIRTRVTIGDNAFIGIGSNVVKDVPEGTTVYGNPARVR